MKATQRSLGQLLNAKVFDDTGRIDIDAVHFAGHGDFDPSRPDGSALFLEDGVPLRSMLFRAAKYGGDRQPLMFLNACMLGIGGELLGDMAGFPGNSLRGGFGGVLGALWEVDDVIAHDLALEFWQRVLPASGAPGEPVGAVLRDLRSKSIPVAGELPPATYLAYVFYGHPRLTLERAPSA
jgi:CHAT domain-containing protein